MVDGVKRAWTGVVSCTRGRGHRRDGTGCDDRGGWRTVDDTTAVALADGCGSSRLGGIAARVAVDAVLSTLDAGPGASLEELAEQMVTAAHESVCELAADLELGPSDCATTLMVAVLRRGDLALAHVGDGVIAGRRRNAWSLLSAPTNGEHANETPVLSSPAFRETLHRARVEGVSACVLLTDGAAVSLFERGTGRVAPAVEKVAHALKTRPRDEVEGWLSNELAPRLTSRTLDDCGLALAVYRR